MNIDNLTYGEMKQIAALFTSVSGNNGTLSPFIGKNVVVRTYSAGVFYGKLMNMSGTEAVVDSARRVHYWDGAASLSQLANEGTTKPENCRFPAEVPRVHLTEVIEVLPLSDKAKKSLDGVKIWQM